MDPDGNGPINFVLARRSGYIRPVGEFSTSAKGVDFIASFEKCELELYEDAGGHATIGYGHLVHTGGITDEDKEQYKNGWTEEKALEIYSQDLSSKEQDVQALFKDNLMTQNKFDAMVSLTYNTGKGNVQKSDLFKLLKKGDNNSNIITETWKKTSIRSSGKVLSGLKKRRAKEAKIYTEGEYENHE